MFVRLFFFFFFFSSRRRHTRYIDDWSSDVCSSDLDHHLAVREHVIDGQLLRAADDHRKTDMTRWKRSRRSGWSKWSSSPASIHVPPQEGQVSTLTPCRSTVCRSLPHLGHFIQCSCLSFSRSTVETFAALSFAHCFRRS